MLSSVASSNAARRPTSRTIAIPMQMRHEWSNVSTMLAVTNAPAPFWAKLGGNVSMNIACHSESPASENRHSPCSAACLWPRPPWTGFRRTTWSPPPGARRWWYRDQGAILAEISWLDQGTDDLWQFYDGPHHHRSTGAETRRLTRLPGRRLSRSQPDGRIPWPAVRSRKRDEPITEAWASVHHGHASPQWVAIKSRILPSAIIGRRWCAIKGCASVAGGGVRTRGGWRWSRHGPEWTPA